MGAQEDNRRLSVAELKKELDQGMEALFKALKRKDKTLGLQSKAIKLLRETIASRDAEIKRLKEGKN